MKTEEFRDKLFKQLIDAGEFTEDDKEAFDKDFNEPQFKQTWELILNIINDAIGKGK